MTFLLSKQHKYTFFCPIVENVLYPPQMSSWCREKYTQPEECMQKGRNHHHLFRSVDVVATTDKYRPRQEAKRLLISQETPWTDDWPKKTRPDGLKLNKNAAFFYINEKTSDATLWHRSAAQRHAARSKSVLLRQIKFNFLLFDYQVRQSSESGHVSHGC
jgi:hypothetical protein